MATGLDGLVFPASTSEKIQAIRFFLFASVKAT